MANLLVTVFAILLVLALVVFGVFYGGDILGVSQKRADAGRLISTGDQIVAAINIYKLDTGQFPNLITDLVPRWLIEEPRGLNGGSWQVGDDAIYTILGTDQQALDICVEARSKVGYSSDDSYPPAPDADDLGPFLCTQLTLMKGDDPCCIQ